MKRWKHLAGRRIVLFMYKSDLGLLQRSDLHCPRHGQRQRSPPHSQAPAMQDVISQYKPMTRQYRRTAILSNRRQPPRRLTTFILKGFTCSVAASCSVDLRGFGDERQQK